MKRNIFLNKIYGIFKLKIDSFIGRFHSLENTLNLMSARPFELHLELTNICNANCLFCSYQFQSRKKQFMKWDVFYKAVKDFCDIGGGMVSLTPIVGDALIDPDFLERVNYLRSKKEISEIKLVTNGILLDKWGFENILKSGLTTIFISTAGFNKEMYERIYRSDSYERMKNNIVRLLEFNSKMDNPINIIIGLRSDKALSDTVKDSDFDEIMQFNPKIDFTWSYSSGGGRITKEMLPKKMKLRVVSLKNEPCVQLFNGPMVLADGNVVACDCMDSMDGVDDLRVGNIMDSSLLQIWRDLRIKSIRNEFIENNLNETCLKCSAYRNLDLYRTQEGRKRAKINKMKVESFLN